MRIRVNCKNWLRYFTSMLSTAYNIHIVTHDGIAAKISHEHTRRWWWIEMCMRVFLGSPWESTVSSRSFIKPRTRSYAARKSQFTSARKNCLCVHVRSHCGSLRGQCWGNGIIQKTSLGWVELTTASFPYWFCYSSRPIQPGHPFMGIGKMSAGNGFG